MVLRLEDLIHRIDIESIIADAKSQSESETLFREVLAETEKANAILFVEDLSGLVRENPRHGAVIVENLRRAVQDGRIQILASGSSVGYDYTIKLWNVANGQKLRTLSGHSDRVSRGAAWAGRRGVVKRG